MSSLGVFGFEIETYMAEVEETALFNWRRRGGGGSAGIEAGKQSGTREILEMTAWDLKRLSLFPLST